ncbi:MAG: undecaprenyl-diphosphate phosphatase [Clostridiales bacterium]|jgi:undecaprenyl-diphosphatase|nr:undecaprenyl-diphosphate phosphatase [Clostridiales bacterium]
MNILKAVILGIVQGFSEFLPVSSSGHLVAAQRLFGLEEQMLSFDIILHLGSLVAVFIVFWKDIWGLLKKPFQNLTYMLIAATIPAVIVGALLKEQIEILFEGGVFLALGFIITGLLLLYSDSMRNIKNQSKDISLPDAIFIGCVQAAAIAPGISRSGSTITAGLRQGLSRENAARFSFLLSVPAILGAALMTAKDALGSPEGAAGLLAAGALPMLLGFLASMLSGYLSIRFMLDLIKKCELRYFSYYVFAVAAFILADIFIMHRFF